MAQASVEELKQTGPKRKTNKTIGPDHEIVRWKKESR